MFLLRAGFWTLLKPWQCSLSIQNSPRFPSPSEYRNNLSPCQARPDFTSHSKMDPGFPILRPQYDLQASAPGGPSACHPLPRAITLSDTGPHPRPPHRPRSRGCGHSSRSTALGALVSGGVRAVQARRWSVYLRRVPQRRRHRRRRHLTLAGAGPEAAWELGHCRASTGPSAGHPGRRRRVSDLPLCSGHRLSSRTLLVRSPRSRHNGLHRKGLNGREKITATTRKPEVPPQSATPAQESLALIGRCPLMEASRPALFWVSALQRRSERSYCSSDALALRPPRSRGIHSQVAQW